jgi:glutamate synthase (NADPH/NADH) small chain
VKTDGHGRTSVVRVYAGGDCVNGGKEVVNAVAEGKAAARAIDADLGNPRG